MADAADTLGDHLAMECGIADVLEDAEVLDAIIQDLIKSDEAWAIARVERMPNYHLFLFTKAQVRTLLRAQTHVLSSARKLDKLFHGDDHD